MHEAKLIKNKVYILNYPNTRLSKHLNTDQCTLRMCNDTCSQLHGLLRYIYKEIDHECMADRLIESPSVSYMYAASQ